METEWPKRITLRKINTVENAEQVHPVAGTKYQTYAASSRLLYADGDIQTPL